MSDPIAGSPTPLRILVVEDDADARANLVDILEMHGHEVQTHARFTDAVNDVGLAQLDVILLDRKLPDGLVETYLSTFRTRAPTTDLIVITGNADLKASIAALREGVTDYILKPIDPEALLRTLQHIGTRRKVEQELRNEHQFAEMVLQTAEAIVLVLDPQGRVTRFNDYLTELTGYTLQEVASQDWFEVFIPERERARIRGVFNETISNLNSRGILNPIVTKSGEEKEIRWSNKVINDETGEVTGVLAVGLDVTDLVEAQQRLRQSDRLAAIGQTITGMAHESRNALQRIRNSVELLEDELDADHEALRYVEKISRAGNDLRDLLEEVRAYAAPIRLNLERVSLRSIWRRAWDSLEAKTRTATLSEELTNHGNLELDVDARRIEQIFRNLFENALDACPEPVEIRIRFESVDGQGIIHVQDNGPGIPADAKRQIFDAFYTTKATGTGLGLAIAQRIVQAHQGTIAVCDCDIGTAFRICLPSVSA